jgi:hypothetical protein
VTARLWQFAVLWHPNEKQIEDGEKSRIAVEPTTILASTEQEAVMRASREIPSDLVDELDQVEIIVGPMRS